MRRIWQRAIVATILTGAACGGEVNGTSSDVDFQETSAAPHPTGEYKTISSEEAGNTSATLTAEAAPPQRIIFFNRNGGTYKRGGEDSRTNSSTIPPGTVTMPAYSRGDAAWTQFMTCMKDEFARFNVVVTDQDPGTANHIEAVISGTPGLVGMGNGVGGVAPMTRDCSLIENAVVYIFEKVLGSNPTTHCEVAAQETAHAIGLDHELLCQDPMTYLSGCGHKTFQDQTVSCGESSARDCACINPLTGSKKNQNSVQFMYQRLGKANGGGGGGDTTPPVIGNVGLGRTTSPTSGQNSIVITASDNTGVADVILNWQFNGKVIKASAPTATSGWTVTQNGNTYTFSANFGTGARPYSVQAIDAAGNNGSKSGSFTFN